MSDNPQEWSHDEFSTFLLLHASYADYDFSESERAAILRTVEPSMLTTVQDYYENLSDYQRLDHLMRAKDTHISTPEAKSKMRDMLERHFEADGEISRPEKTLLNFLDMLL